MDGVRVTLAIKSLARGMVKLCPVCGNGKIFRTWFELKPECPRCRFDFDREPGWWIGGMLINTCMSIILLVLVGGLGIWLFWPEVPWTGLTIACMATMTVFPVFFYPISKTLWLALDLVLGGMDEAVRE